MARGVGRNILLSAASWLIPSVVAVVAIPITVHGLGDDRYGAMALVGAVTGYLGIMDLGLGQGIVRYLSRFVALAHGRAIRECLRAMLGWFGTMGVLGAVLTWAMAPWVVGRLLEVPATLVPEVTVALRVGGISFLLGMLVTVFQFVPEAFLRYGLASRLNIALGSISLAGPALLVSLGYGLIPVMWFGAALNGLACILWGAAARNLIGGVPNEGPKFTEYLREFLGFAWTSAVNRIWGVVQAQTSKTIVGVAGGTALTAYYAIPAVLSQKVTSLLYQMSKVLLPTASQLEADGERRVLLALYQRSSRLFFVLNGSVTGALVVFAEPLLRYWVGPRYANEGTIALQMLTFAAGLNAVSMAASQMNLALGRPKVNLAFSLVNSAINLSTVYGLTVAYGIAGTALSGLLAAAVVPAFIHYSHKRILDVRTWLVFRDSYLRTLIAVSCVVTVAWSVLKPLASSLVGTLALVCVVSAAGLVASAMAGAVTAEDWATMRVLMRALVGRRGKLG